MPATGRQGGYICRSCEREFFTQGDYDADREMCRQCIRDADQLAASPGSALALPAGTGSERASGFQSGPLLTFLGLAFLGLGIYFLLNPGVAIDRSAVSALGGLGVTIPDSVANLQRLAFGQTFTIVGAVFLAAAWRPRR